MRTFTTQVAVEGLSKMLSKGCDLGYDKSASIQNVKRILQCSELVSGLKVNFFESTSIGFGPDSEIISDMALSLRCKVESLHSMYLGLPIRASSHYSAMWKPAINRISRRLTSWKERYLSVGGRICLIKSMLCNLPLYYLSFLSHPCFGCLLD